MHSMQCGRAIFPYEATKQGQQQETLDCEELQNIKMFEGIQHSLCKTKSCSTLSGSTVTTAWRVVGLRIEETASR
jgi:hypothetical protein